MATASRGADVIAIGPLLLFVAVAAFIAWPTLRRRWVDADEASDKLVRSWDRMFTALEEHEHEHRDIWREAIRVLRERAAQLGGFSSQEDFHQAMQALYRDVMDECGRIAAQKIRHRDRGAAAQCGCSEYDRKLFHEIRPPWRIP